MILRNQLITLYTLLFSRILSLQTKRYAILYYFCMYKILFYILFFLMSFFFAKIYFGCFLVYITHFFFNHHKGEIVYANYGSDEDFRTLKKMGIFCKDKILLIRYGTLARNKKVLCYSFLNFIFSYHQYLIIEISLCFIC